MQGFNVIILWKEPQAFLCNISIPTDLGNSYTITEHKELQHLQYLLFIPRPIQTEISS